jgi:hypothetical protein
VTEIDVRCGVIAELATRYLEDALDAEERLTYETHLVFCTNCVAFHSDLRKLALRLRELPADPVEPEERRLVVDAAAGER